MATPSTRSGFTIIRGMESCAVVYGLAQLDGRVLAATDNGVYEIFGDKAEMVKPLEPPVNHYLASRDTAYFVRMVLDSANAATPSHAHDYRRQPGDFSPRIGIKPGATGPNQG